MKWKNLALDTNVYFITATVTEWQPLFRYEEPRRILLADFDFYRRKHRASILAYVLMPEHYHLILALKTPDDLPCWLRDVQGHSGRELAKWLAANAHPRHLAVFQSHGSGGAKLAVWKEQARALGITSVDVLRTKIDYLHNNPVRRNLVSHPADWQWSSWRNYYLEDGSVLAVDRIEDFPSRL